MDYKRAPLPFVGQKRNFLRAFKKVIEEKIPNDGEGFTILDAFGGSGLLSHTAKKLKPKARVIYNDFDNYAERLANIEDTNRLRRLLFNALQKCDNKRKLNKEQKEEIINIIKSFDGYVDMESIRGWITFSGSQPRTLEELFKFDFWKQVRSSDYPPCDHYLDGLEVVHEDFESLLNRFKNDKKCIYVLDPPYICTLQSAYKKERYFDLIDFMKLVNLCRRPFIFFSASKSEFIRFIDYLIEYKLGNYTDFENYERITEKGVTGKTCVYEDNMIYKF